MHRRRRLPEAEDKRLAKQGKAYLARILGTGRPWLTRLAQPPPDWFAQFAERRNDGEWFDRLEGKDARPFTDAEALAIVRQDRRYAPGLKLRIEDRLVGISHAIEPGVLAAHRRFFQDLADAFAPRRGTRSEWYPAQIWRLYEARHQWLIELQAEYRRTGKLPPVEALPVFDIVTIKKNGVRDVEPVTIELDDDWATLATWAFLEAWLATPRGTLKRIRDRCPLAARTLNGFVTAAPRLRRSRKPPRR